jgi:CBS domain-containing protein
VAETPTREEQPVDLRRTPVRAVMSSMVVALQSSSRLGVAVDTFVTTGLRHLAVVDPEGRSVGILSQERASTAWLDPVTRHASCVREIMGDPNTTVHADTTVQQVARLMSDTGLDAVPVVQPDGRLIGVVTRTDLVGLLAGRPRLDVEAHAAGSATVRPDHR